MSCATRAPRRRVGELITCHSARRPLQPQAESEWEVYLRERQVFVGQEGKPGSRASGLPTAFVLPAVASRSSSPLSDFAPLGPAPIGNASPPLASPRLFVGRTSLPAPALLAAGRITEIDRTPSEGSHSSDDLPLGVVHPRPATTIGWDQPRQASRAGRPRPSSLGPAHHSLSDGNLARAAQDRPDFGRRRSTLLDLDEEAPAPFVGFNRRTPQQGPERIVTHDWHGVSLAPPLPLFVAAD